EPLGDGHDVVVEEHQELPTRGADARVARDRGPRVGLTQRPDLEGEGLPRQPVPRPIGRAVVDDDHLEYLWGNSLRAEGVQHAPQSLAAIVRGDDDAEPRCGHARAAVPFGMAVSRTPAAGLAPGGAWLDGSPQQRCSEW